MCSLVSADPSSGGGGVGASRPFGNTRSDSFSTPLRPPCRICGSPALIRAERRRSKTRSMPALLIGAASRSALPAHAAREHLGQHGEVPTQAVERIAESGRRVAFEKKVPRPRGQVAGERHRQQPRPAGGNHRAGGDRDREQRTAHVQPARGAVAVFAEIIRIELAKAREARRRRSGWRGGSCHGSHGAQERGFQLRAADLAAASLTDLIQHCTTCNRGWLPASARPQLLSISFRKARTRRALAPTSLKPTRDFDLTSRREPASLARTRTTTSSLKPKKALVSVASRRPSPGT